MKLFIAINFKKSIRFKIGEVIREIKHLSTQGKFVKNDHLHLTLEFFGDIWEDRIYDVISVMNKVSTKGFLLKADKIDFFRKSIGNIYYIGFKENSRLLDLQKELHDMLLEKNFKLEEREYTPHITIGRKVILKENSDLEKYVNTLSKIRLKVDSIELMQSQHLDGKLIYTVICSKKL